MLNVYVESREYLTISCSKYIVNYSLLDISIDLKKKLRFIYKDIYSKYYQG